MHWGADGGALLLAEQDAVVPPLAPVQVQAHGPVPETDDAVPIAQRFAVGADGTVVPFALPHTPLTGVGGGGLPLG